MGLDFCTGVEELAEIPRLKSRLFSAGIVP